MYLEILDLYVTPFQRSSRHLPDPCAYKELCFTEY